MRLTPPGERSSDQVTEPASVRSVAVTRQTSSGVGMSGQSHSPAPTQKPEPRRGTSCGKKKRAHQGPGARRGPGRLDRREQQQAAEQADGEAEAEVGEHGRQRPP